MRESKRTINEALVAARRWAASVGLLDLARAILIVALFTSAGLATRTWAESDNTCLSCHPATSRPARRHGSATCVDCHRPLGLSGALRYTTGYGRMLASSWLLGKKAPAPGAQSSIEQDACIRCHRSLLGARADAGRKVRVSHRHLWDLGLRCDRCHDLPGHTTGSRYALRGRSAMSECLKCHDGEENSAGCALCHQGRPSDSARSRRTNVPLERDSYETCRGCHSAKLAAECIACHGGYEMPHPVGWMKGGHYYPGLTDKSNCGNCHPQPQGLRPPDPHRQGPGQYGGYFCNRCHAFPSPHGSSAAWRANHGPASRGRLVRQPTCEGCHSSSFVKDCQTCHSQESCARCHAGRNAPVGRA